MSDEKPMEAKNPDDLTKTKKPTDVQMNEEELNKVAGGFSEFTITKYADKASPL